ncbi:MAG: M12 family metallo-peptidase [Acidobacteriota bacterium]|nr:M12 family metallo-peptidase [Acidobacteriota bacterium]
MKHPRIFGSPAKTAAVLILLLLGSVLSGWAEEIRLFERGAPAGLMPAPPPDFPAAVRMRPVALAPQVRTPGLLTEGDTLVLDLFPDRVYRARIDRTDVNVNGTLTIRGRIEGHPLGYVLISTTEGRSLAAVRIPETSERYLIQSEPSSARTHYLIEPLADLLDVAPVGPSRRPPPPTIQENVEIAGIKEKIAASGPEDPAYIDVMIVYTPAARDWADASGGGIANVVAQAMAKAQLALDNSNTILTISLVRSLEVDYMESGDSEVDIDRLTFHAGYDPWDRDPDRYMDEVHEWRDRYGADLVSMFARVDDVGGLGWLLDRPSGRSRLGFSLARIQQAAHTFTHIHEMGHNMGCDHHRDQNEQPGPGLFDYSAGWRWVGDSGGRFCSIMTYESGQYFADGQRHIRTAHFSNPDILHQGVSTGLADKADNARNIREVKHVVAAYRTVPTIRLTIMAGSGGTTDPAPGIRSYIVGDKAVVTAVPSNHHAFVEWSGDASGSANPIEIVMDRDKIVRANFRIVQPPANVSGRRIENRSLLQREHINILRWQSNSANEGIAISSYRIYRIEGGLRILIGETSSAVFEYWHRNVSASGPYVYEIVAVGSGGRDGLPASMTIR